VIILARIGHNLTPEEILRRVSEYWDLSGKFPLTKSNVECPVCRASGDDVIIRLIGFTVRNAGGMPYRANVSFKCTRCSAVWVHGVVIPEKMAKLHGLPKRPSKNYHWREILKEISRKR